jgi:hypothetical protein
MTDLNEITTNTPAKYLFKLVSDTDFIICDPEPIEWKAGTLEIKRDLEVGGVFSSFQVDSLTFVGNGAEFLKKLFTTYELNAKCTLIIYWWNGSIREYVEFPSRFDINFNFYEIVKVGKFYFGVRVKAINSSIQTKLDNRQDIDVDITKLTSIGGFQIKDYAGLKKGLYYDGTNVCYSAQLKKEATKPLEIATRRDVNSYTAIPLNVVSKDYHEVFPVEYKTYSALTFITPFFNTAKYDYEFDLAYKFKFFVSKKHAGTPPWNVQVIETSYVGSHEVIVNTFDIESFGNDLGYVNFDSVASISVKKGNSLKLVVLMYGFQDTQAFFISSDITISQTVSNTEALLSEGFPVYEAMERTCQHMLDKQYPFYSDFFGRTDVNYSETEKYSSENQLRFCHIQSGLNQRGLKLSDAPITLNFKDLFNSLKAIYNVGYSIEDERIRIEQYSYFFKDVLALDLSARINKYDIQSQVMPELVPVNIKSGFDNYEYLTLNGLGEPNTTNQRTSIMNTATKFENISPLRGDTKGILDNLANRITTANGTEDTKGDSDNFIIKSQRNIAYGWKPEKNENIEIVNGTSLFKEDLMNRYFTPSRMLRRHGNKVKSGMMKYTGSVLTFQKSDKSSTLKTTGEGYTITESDDIPVSDLDAPIYKPMKHTVDVLFTFSDLEALQVNRFGYIKFSNEISGYLLSLKKKNNEDKAEITIIEKS